MVQVNLEHPFPNSEDQDSTLKFLYGWKIVTTPTRFTLVHPDGHEQCLAATREDPEVIKNNI